METLQSANDVLFVLLGAIMVLAMHAGFAFLEVGTVRPRMWSPFFFAGWQMTSVSSSQLTTSAASAVRAAVAVCRPD